MTRKVCVVITARPSYSRVKTALNAVKHHPNLQLQLVVAASALLDRFGNALNYMYQDDFVPDAKVFMVVEGENLATMAKTTGLGLMELATVFDNLQPDIVMTIADRFETIATAIAASYMNIPLVHLQGGEVTGSIDEKVRHAVTKLSDHHFVSTALAAERIEKMGETRSRIHITGCPSIDLAAEIIRSPVLDFNPFEKYGGVGDRFELSNKYLVVMQHPVTTEYGEARPHVQATLEAVHKLGLPTFWFWPNVDAGSDGTSKAIRVFRENNNPKQIHFFKNMEGKDFLRLLFNSACLIGNSSVGIRECSFLGVPVVNIGSRQQGRERGENVVDVDYDKKDISDAIRHQIGHEKYAQDFTYGDGNSDKRIAKKLATIELTCEKRLTY